MDYSKIKRLNNMFGEALGFVGNESRYAWRRTASLYYFIQEGTQEIKLPGGTVSCIVPKYKRHSWADMLGHDQWMLAHWQKPTLTEQQWLTSFGNEWPYPYAGQYYAIENATPGPGVEPTADDTLLVIRRIKEQTAANFRSLVQTATANAQKPFDDAKKESDDQIDSDWPAFDNMRASEDRLGQSRGGSVSFGGIGS